MTNQGCTFVYCELCGNRIHWKQYEKMISQDNYMGVNICPRHKRYHKNEI